MNEHGAISAFLWAILASVAGALTALSYRPFEKMTKAEIFFSVFVGASFAIFVGPWVVKLVFGADPIDLRLQGALYYLLATGSNVLVPLLVRKLSGFFGTEEKR